MFCKSSKYPFFMEVKRMKSIKITKELITLPTERYIYYIIGDCTATYCRTH